MDVLVIGSGAREHCLAWKIRQSNLVDRLFCAPGNAGTSLVAENVPIAADDLPALVQWAKVQKIGLTVVGPEVPLVAGIAEVFAEQGQRIFGPSKAAAQLEGSKAFSKELLLRHGIPTAWGASFRNATAAKEYVWAHDGPIVVKADGLAAGKGVVVAQTADEALMAIDEIMVQRVFGEAGDCVIVEECLSGPEVSCLALTDGEAIVPLVPACDYKRVGDGDQGPNTGGMGSYSPPGFATPAMLDEINNRILLPTVRAMAMEGHPYRGVLYAGIMLTPEGPKALEFNCRFGDPETQVILPRLQSDLVPLMLATIDGTLAQHKPIWHNGASCGVVLTSGGYPGHYRQGIAIDGLDDLDGDALLFHAGTHAAGGKVVTAGGRVLTVVALGDNMARARERAYRAAGRIHFDGCQYRRDIALRELKD
jgi:phosphoribosylamine--glycine ligase